MTESVTTPSRSPFAPRQAPAEPTHEVFNQPPPLQGYDLFAADPVLPTMLERLDAESWRERLSSFGRAMGEPAIIELGELANRNPPVLRTHDRFGHRADRVDFHPAWHELMALAVENELHCLPWSAEGRPDRAGAQVARSSLLYLLTQVEAGVTCPLSMSSAAVPALRHQPEVAEHWLPLLSGRRYDSRFVPPTEKSSVLLGMAMTEKQGGSDVRANTTRAVPEGEPGSGRPYLLTGHKWFCSAPMCDAFLTLAQAEEGLSCFLVPRFRPDGSRNRFHLQRLKDKLGNRSNASSEIEYADSWAVMVGPPGRGVPTIIEMVNMTRLDCVTGSAGLMRQAVAQACHHAAHRSAFGRRLVEQPLMRAVLADLALESEAATLSFLRLARAWERAGSEPSEAAFARLATAVLKYWTCKRCPAVVGEALECHGGNGYVEESILPRLYREAPLGSIWEGSGNVICLDVLRAMERSPRSVSALLDELRSSGGRHAGYDRWIERLEAEIGRRPTTPEARSFVEALALALQASLLLRFGAEDSAAAFCDSRLASDRRASALGTLPPHLEVDGLIERATPVAG